MAFAQGLTDLPLPGDATILRSGASITILGNGNTCEYEVWEEFETPLPKEEVLAHFEGAVIAPISSGSQYPVWVTIEGIGASLESGREIYRLTGVDISEVETFDIRCH